MKKHALGIAALGIGIVALGLAVIPGIALDRPLPLLADDDEERPQIEPKPNGGFTLKFKDFAVTFGGKKDKNNADGEAEHKVAPDAAADDDRPKKRNNARQLIKWFTIAAVACSLMGLILGPIAYVREKQLALSGSAIGICCLAIVWQYIVIGIALGVAIVVLLIFLSHFAN